MTSTTVKLSTNNTTSDSIGFGVTDGSYGYIIPGADTVTPFKTSILIGTNIYTNNITIDIKSIYSNYANLTNNNFLFLFKDGACYNIGHTSSNTINGSMGCSYNSSTGIVTVKEWYAGYNDKAYAHKVDIYLIV